MKFIPKEELLLLIKSSNVENFSQQIIDDLFDSYGDDYYIEGGSWGHWEKCKENEFRKNFIKRKFEEQTGENKDGSNNK